MSSLSDELVGTIVDGREVRFPRYSQIEGRLWVGAMPAVQVPNSFSSVVNLNPGMNYALHQHQLQLCFPMRDERELPGEQLLLQILGHIYVMDKQGPVLIHCREGLNRAPFVAALFLIASGWTPAAAVKAMKEKRSPHVFTNDTYERYLLEIDGEDLKWE